MLQCFVCSLTPKVSEKRATGQSFIRQEITSYRIGTLIVGPLHGKEIHKMKNMENLSPT